MSVASSAAALTAPPVEHPPGFRARRVQNWVFLGLMYGFFYMSRYNFSAISVAIGEKFGWTNAQFGWIITAGKATYGAAVLLNGPLADRIGGKRAILIGSAGAAVFNFLFGMCFIFLGHSAVMKGSSMVTPAVLVHGMKATTMLATFATLWALNHYFQSFGALSIVKINAAWFHVRERGVFAGIFGVMIQGGRQLAFLLSPFILSVLPWQYCFWIPAAVLVVMFFVNRRYVEDSPAAAGFDFHTADETKEEEQQKPSLSFVLRKVFASPAMWMITFSSMCIGMVRNGIDDWWARYIRYVFNVPAEKLGKFGPYLLAAWGQPFAAVLGGLAAGIASDKLFGSRRAPVIFFAFIGQGVTLFLLSQTLHSAWAGCCLLVLIAFFIQSAHSLVGGAASMDFGGKKAVATAAGLFDGAQYLAGAVMGVGLGTLIDSYRNAKLPGVEYDVWPLAPIPFTILGAILISRLWNVIPGRVQNLDAAKRESRARTLSSVHLFERVTMGAWAMVAGAVSVLTIILPQLMARELYSHQLGPSALVWSQLFAGARLSLAIIALAASMAPRAPRALVRALVIGLAATLAGPIFSALTNGVPWSELQPLRFGLYLDGATMIALLVTSVLRANLAPLPE